MKVIQKKSMNVEQKERVQIEKQIIMNCDSPFIVKLHYTFQTPTKLFFILDYVNGGELHTKLLKAQKLNEDTARFYTAEILLALKCLHENKTLYRDLTPRNILLDSEGHVKLIDFGLSKLDFDEEDKRQTICGTACYLSPDMLKGEKHSVMMDYWSLGILLYEMLHGYYPFLRDQVSER